MAGGRTTSGNWLVWLCAQALAIKDPPDGLDQRLGFLPFATVLPQDHEFDRRFGWISEADLRAAHDLLVDAEPSLALDRAETEAVRRRHRMQAVKERREYVPPPLPRFTVPSR